MSLEELLQIEITSVSKHPEKLALAPAAVSALTTDDLRRSGSGNLPDALRLVPGMQVAAVDAHSWAISARGFPDVFANKLLVLRDGRSLYTPLFSGVFWDAQDTVLEDIERIEVVRGPGATLWGANAVNGVINILTKTAAQTVGTMVSTVAGTDSAGSLTVRYGAALSQTSHYRVYAKYSRYAESELAGGGRGLDSWKLAQTGFRFDRTDTNGALLTVQGDAYAGRQHTVFLIPNSAPPYFAPIVDEPRLAGTNLLARWTRPEVLGGELMVQGYFDYTHRDTAIFREDRETFDLEAQHRIIAANGQKLTLGTGFRTTVDDVGNTPTVLLNPASRRTDLWNVFLQDDIPLRQDVLHLIIGSKFERNDFTGWEVQPGSRLLWTPNEQHTLWTSVARAARTPSRSDADITLHQLTSLPILFAHIQGNRSFDSELLTAYEAGYRLRPNPRMSIDLAVFYHDYSRLRTTEIDPSSLPLLGALAIPGLITSPVTVSTTIGNLLDGSSHGVELSLAWQVTPSWRLRATYSQLQLRLTARPDSLSIDAEAEEGRSPRNQASFWSQHDLGRSWEFDWRASYADQLESLGVPARLGLDARLAWHPSARWELSLNGRNLTDPHHPEFTPGTILVPPTEVRRSFQIRLRYDY